MNRAAWGSLGFPGGARRTNTTMPGDVIRMQLVGEPRVNWGPDWIRGWRRSGCEGLSSNSREVSGGLRYRCITRFLGERMSDESSPLAGDDDKLPSATSAVAPQPVGKTPGIVTAAFVLSILGFCGITAVVGIILGIVGRKDARKAGSGEGLAVAAIIIGVAWIALMVIGGVIGAVSGGNSATNSSSHSSSVTAPKVEAQPKAAVTEAPAQPVQTDWFPKGYHEFSDGVAYKWANAKSDCYQCSYWSMYVIARDGCPSSVYAEINIVDKGTVISYTNDTLGGLEPMQKGLMKFESYESLPNGTQGQLKDISCY